MGEKRRVESGKLNENTEVTHAPASVVNTNSHAGDYLHVNLLNARSVVNKTAEIHDHVLDQHCDILAITETWMRPDDPVTATELTPSGYSFHHVPRVNRQGGGVGVLFKNEIVLSKKSTYEASSFESVICTFQPANGKSLILVVIYRPPSSSFSTFLEEVGPCLEESTVRPHELLVVGDFNIHIDSCTDRNGMEFSGLLDDLSLQQHISEPTHTGGHTLDLVISRKCDELVTSTDVSDFLIADHKAVMVTIEISKPPIERKQITYRKLRSINIDALANDIRTADMNNTEDVEGCLAAYDTCLSTLLEQHAPLRTKMITIRQNAPWFTDELQAAKQERRRRENCWRRTNLQSDQRKYREQRNVVNGLLCSSKTGYFSRLVQGKSKNPRELFKVIDGLIHGQQQSSALPDHSSTEELAHRFCEFFTTKIENIRLKLLADQIHCSTGRLPTWDPPIQTPWSTFALVTKEQLTRLIQKSPTKTCSLDPMPTWLLKNCLPVLIGPLTHIINRSFIEGSVPLQMKTAVVSPVLKKPSLDENDMKNYRPISNLSFTSKTLERVVADQLNHHMTANEIHEPFQSAYRSNHSVETALLRVQNDILMSMDRGEASILVLLDLSAAFDTVDHTILLQRLKCIGISGIVHQWFQSYLSDRCQNVKVGESSSRSLPLRQGVPQGSVLGPVLFSVYMLPLGSIVRTHGLTGHFYADDTQLFISFKPHTQLHDAETKLTACCRDIRKWMTTNMLKLNGAKTEMVVFGNSGAVNSLSHANISIGDATIAATPSARNLGCIQDSALKMDKHISQVCRTAFYHLKNISRIRRYLHHDAVATTIHAFVTSRLDFCNSLLYGITKRQLTRLQRAQNSAARILSGTGRRDHITPVLKTLHWLPVEQRIRFKMFLITFKAVHETAPTYISDLLHPYTSPVNVRAASNGLLAIPPTRLVTAGDRAFEHAAPHLWNSLPQWIRASPSLTVFKTAIKTFLFSDAFDP